MLLAAVLCLGALLAGWLIWQGYRNERRAMEKHLADTVAALATLTETELGKREALLRGLAVSSVLAAGELAAFHEQARRALPDNESILLVDEQRRQLVNTRVAYGTPLKSLLAGDDFDEAMRAGRTFISGVQKSASGRDILFVALPIQPAGGGRQALCLVTTPVDFTSALLNHRIGQGWLISIIDRDMRIAGRSRNPDSFIGKTASEGMARLLRSDHGVAETTTLDGVPSITAFHRAPHAGWTVIVAAPRAELFAAAQRLTLQALVIAIGAGGLAILFALWVGRSVIAGVRSLVKATETLGRGEQFQARPTGIREIDFVSNALASTSEALAARETALARARDEALAASRTKDEFLAALSHELRTPLNPVLLLASDAAKDSSLDPAVREIFSTIARNVSIEARLIDDLLDLTRISSGKLSLHLQNVSIDRLLHDTVETLRRQIVEKPLALTLDLQCGGALIAGDSTRLQQVFWNLLNNALKFTAPGGGIAVSSRVDTTAGRIVVAIRDSGLGMSAAEIARLFQRFVQGDHAASGTPSIYGGLGLGLAIARTIVEMHQGEITAQSPGRHQGSTFTVRLPLLIRKPGASLHPVRDNDSPAHAPAKAPGRRLLLVEDHKPTLQTLEKLLTRRHHKVTTAGTTGDALALASSATFDLVISDIGLPDRSGYELMRELRDRHGLKGIAMSGYGADADRAQSKAAGFLFHLTKPVNISALEEAIHRVFNEAP